jgi:hypothetical protein
MYLRDHTVLESGFGEIMFYRTFLQLVQVSLYLTRAGSIFGVCITSDRGCEAVSGVRSKPNAYIVILTGRPVF